MGCDGEEWGRVVKTPHYNTILLGNVNVMGWLNNNSHTYKENKFSARQNTHLLKKGLTYISKKPYIIV